MAAAVGSLMILVTVMPALSAAALVDDLCRSVGNVSAVHDVGDGALDLLSGLLLRLPHELLEHHAGELLRGVRPAVQFGAGGVGAHADLEDGGDASSPAPLHVLGIVADEDRAIVHEADDGRSEVLLVLVADDVRPGSFSVIPGNGGVRRPEVDTDPHLCIPFGCIISY